jgi:hypothetical protein
MYKVVNNLVPEYLQCFKPISHGYNTRSAARGQLYSNKASLNYFTRSFRYEGTRLWNDLSSDIQGATSVNAFKSRFLNKYFKSS